MIEYGDAEERKVALATMGGIEQTVWVRIGESGEKVFAITNEDMERTRDEKPPPCTSCASNLTIATLPASNQVHRFLWALIMNR